MKLRKCDEVAILMVRMIAGLGGYLVDLRPSPGVDGWWVTVTVPPVPRRHHGGTSRVELGEAQIQHEIVGSSVEEYAGRMAAALVGVVRRQLEAPRIDARSKS